MGIGKYNSLNVLSNNQRSILNKVDSEQAIAEVSAMINCAGNRAQKRRLEKNLRKVEKIQAKCEEYTRAKANREIDIRSDENFMYVFAAVGLTLIEDYRWKEDPDQDHGQITSFYERLTKRMEKYATQGLSTNDMIDLLDEKCGVRLVNSNNN